MAPSVGEEPLKAYAPNEAAGNVVNRVVTFFQNAKLRCPVI
jgi:hypothetical protein